jgi:hypothetical protein
VSHCGPLERDWRLAAFPRLAAANGRRCRCLGCWRGCPALSRQAPPPCEAQADMKEWSCSNGCARASDPGFRTSVTTAGAKTWIRRRRWTEALEAEGVAAVRRALERSRAGPPGMIRIAQNYVTQGFAEEWLDWHDSRKKDQLGKMEVCIGAGCCARPLLRMASRLALTLRAGRKKERRKFLFRSSTAEGGRVDTNITASPAAASA